MDDNINIIEWKVIGTQENFTVIALSDQAKIYYWKDQKWNIL
jgi:hypothetical protein